MEKIEINVLLEELEEYINEASRLPFMSKVIVDGDYVLEIIDKIHAIMPEEVKQAKQVLDQSDKLLETIEGQGKKIIEDAREKARQMVQEHALVEVAKQEAESIVGQAMQESKSLQDDAKSYADTVLFQLETNLEKAMSVVKKGRQDLGVNR